MALIKCPECGRENVSDMAIQCPECGYGIKEHFEREQRRAEQERILQEKEKAESERIQNELNRELEKIDELRPSPEPVKPSLLKHIFYYDGHLSVLSWALIAGCALFRFCFVSRGIFSFLSAVLIVIGIPIAACITSHDYNISISCYERKHKDWEDQQRDWDGYIKMKKESIRLKYKNIASNAEYRIAKRTPEVNTPTPSYRPVNKLKCPVCESTNVRKISTLNRGVSVLAVGLASSKIGKQYECENCKHKW